MNLITIYDSQGNCIGQCNAKCYNAKHEKCDCVCGGKNHGKGEEIARENTQEHWHEWTEEGQRVKIPGLQIRMI